MGTKDKKADKKTIVAQRGEVEKEFDFVRVDDCFKCPVCGKKKRASKAFCSTTCRWNDGNKQLAKQIVSQITQPTEHATTLLIQTLLTSTKKEDLPK